MQHYAEQDQIDPGRERLRSPEIIGRRQWPPTPTAGKRTNEMALKLYFVDRQSTRQIADQLYISRRYVQKIIRDGKKLLQKNLQNSPK